MKIPEWATNLFSSATNTTAHNPNEAEQMKEVIDAALDFDKLVVMPGWNRALAYMIKQVNAEIAEATSYKYEPTRQAVHVTRWDAKRELLDGLQNYIEAQQTERTRIVDEFKGKLQDVT